MTNSPERSLRYAWNFANALSNANVAGVAPSSELSARVVSEKLV